MTRISALVLALGLCATQAFAAKCPEAPPPIVSLSYESRYQDTSSDRSELDPKADAAANDALAPVDDFLRDLTLAANDVFRDGTDRQAVSDCVVGQIAVWARAGALGDLKSPTSNLTIGARIAGFGLILLQVLPDTSRTDDVTAIKTWLAGLQANQTAFWENDAPVKARRGNLRAWAALSAAAAADILQDDGLRAWAHWSVVYVMCSADADGSLPQEMSRGKYALKYQLHAIAPLVVTALLLDHAGADVQTTCDHALARIIGFAAADVDNGAATEAITGKPQSFFDGTDKVQGFHLAWIVPYLMIDTGDDRKALEKLAKRYKPLNYSKLGGDQALIWNGLK